MMLLVDVSVVKVLMCQTMNFTPPPVPYWFQTPKGSDIDLRLINRGELSTILLVTWLNRSFVLYAVMLKFVCCSVC